MARSKEVIYQSEFVLKWRADDVVVEDEKLKEEFIRLLVLFGDIAYNDKIPLNMKVYYSHVETEGFGKEAVIMFGRGFTVFFMYTIDTKEGEGIHGGDPRELAKKIKRIHFHAIRIAIRPFSTNHVPDALPQSLYNIVYFMTALGIKPEIEVVNHGQA